MPAGNITADGTLFSGFSPKGTSGNWNSQFHISGTWGGGTVTIYFMAEDSTIGPNSDGWLPITGGAYTADDDDIINATGRRTYKAVLSGSTSPDLDWNMV